MKGYRTYVILAALILKQTALPSLGIQIPDQDIDKAVDVVLLILAGIFRYSSTKKRK